MIHWKVPEVVEEQHALTQNRGVASGADKRLPGVRSVLTGPAETFSGPAGYLVGLRAGSAGPLATPMTQKEIQLVNDIGLWDDRSEDIRNRWIAKGSEDCRNNCNNLIHGTEGYHRYCSKSFFTRIHPLIGESAERILLRL